MKAIVLPLATFAILLASIPPSTDAQWVHTNGPYGCGINDMTASNNNIFALASPGLFRSTDQGSSWMVIGQNVAGFTIVADGDKLFISPGVSLSTDGGVTWNGAITGIPSDGGVAKVAIVNKTLFACVLEQWIGTTPYGIYRSTDDGAQWLAVWRGGNFNCMTADVTPAGDTVLYAGTGSGDLSNSNSGVFLSTDNGGSWSSIGLGDMDVQAILAFHQPAGASTILAGTRGGIFRSTNKGLSWDSANVGLADSNVSALAALSGDSAGSTIFAGTPRGSLYRSTNGGEPWCNVGRGLLSNSLGGSVSSIKILGSDVFVCTSAGIFRSTDDGDSWTLQTEGMPFAWVNALAVHPNGTENESIFAAACGVFRTTDNGEHWVSTNNGLQSTYVNAFAVSGDNIYVGAQTGVYRSTNDGASWTLGNSGMTNDWIFSLAAFGSNVLVGSGADCIYRSTDYGSSWSQVYSGTSGNSNVLGFAIIGANVIAGSQDGMFRSTDSGATWTRTDRGVPYLTSFAVSGTTIYTGIAGSGVFASMDYGNTWASINSGLPLLNSYLFAVSGTDLFVGGSGIFLSTNAGDSWTRVDSTLTAQALVASNTNLFAAEGGVWRRPLSEMSAVHEVTSTVPKTFSLSQNYPNPFNPSTTIRYALPGRAHVTLSVFNTLGELVSTLVNDTEEAGYHDVMLDGTNLASGVYFYRLTAGSFAQTRKLLIVK